VVVVVDVSILFNGRAMTIFRYVGIKIMSFLIIEAARPQRNRIPAGANTCIDRFPPNKKREKKMKRLLMIFLVDTVRT
jgi:hypothetical protein